MSASASGPGLFHKLKVFTTMEASSVVRYLVEILIQAPLRYLPSIVGVLLRACFYYPLVKANGVFYVRSGVILKHMSGLTLGRNAYIDHNVFINAQPQGVFIGENSRVMFGAEVHAYNYRDLPNAGIRIGDNSVIGHYNVLTGQGGITIGDHVILAPGVKVLAVNHKYDDPDVPIAEQGISAKGIRIEDNVWVGAGATILDGVRIGSGSVIGAGAVVTRDIPPNSFAVGVPARVTKERIGSDARPD